MELNKLREVFLSFFESKNHLKLKSFPLIPENDNSLLLINSGMAPMKKFFSGAEIPPQKRIVTCQKCIRTPDIDQVGITSRHGTFFEMLGNFSFGDYFKKEAISWAFEFCTKTVGLSSQNLVVSVFEDDEETYRIWKEVIKISPEKILKFGKDNFWEHGAGPCGPCSEIYFDRGEKYGCGNESCTAGCDCDRYVEIWNLVFTQFSSDGNGNYTKLENFGIDTGMGLERLAMITQKVDSFFEIDAIKNILNFVCKQVNVTYGEDNKSDICARIVTDHIRSVVFMASDGIMPSNEGRGYVMRKLIRRAIRYGKIIGFKENFLEKLCDIVVKENEYAYEDLNKNLVFIKKILYSEEKNFSKTIDQGLLILNKITSKPNFKILSGENAFLLHDTYGFPIDLTKEIMRERGFKIDIKGFEEFIEKQRKRSNVKSNFSSESAWSLESSKFKGSFSTKFVGYDAFSVDAKVLSIFKDEKNVNSVFYDENSDECYIVLDKTPFYPEGGGQISDKGVLSSDDALLEVVDLKKISGLHIHRCKIKSGSVSVGDVLSASVDKFERKNISRNHTAAHLLHSALRVILGNHVRQAGQLVNNKNLRFDFSHPSKLTENEIIEIENMINCKILDSIKIENSQMSLYDAKRKGATALFSEKYGDIVRVVKINDFSMELCSGTHVSNTSEICLFKISSESSVAAGVRRVEAFTGAMAMEFVGKYQNLVKDACKILKQNDLIKGLNNLLVLEQKNMDKIRKFESKFSSIEAQKLLKCKRDLKFSLSNKNVKIITGSLIEVQMPVVRDICDEIRNKSPDTVAVISSSCLKKLFLVISVGSEAQKLGLDAGNLIKILSKLAGGNGGGNSKIAAASISIENKLFEIFNQIDDVIFNSLQG
jgi:alanyl-tRNA synthetase